MEETLFLELAQLCENLSKTTKRLEKINMISNFLKKLKSDEIAPSTLLIIGWNFPESLTKPLGISYATLMDVVNEKKQETLLKQYLTIKNVKNYFEKIASLSGPGSKQKKKDLLLSLLSQASPLEMKWIIKNIFGEMQHGVSNGLMIEAIAYAANIEEKYIRRANMFIGDIGKIAEIALTKGKEGILSIGIELLHPVKPMLAEMSYDLKEVFKEHNGITALEYKLDGARVQIHRKNDIIKIFSRRLSDVTESLPDIIEIVKEKINAKEFIIDGEIIGIGENGKPLPFQDLMRRFKRIRNIDEIIKEIPVKLFLFDIMYLDRKSLIDKNYEERWKILSSICDKEILVNRIITSDLHEAENFLKKAIEEGHEGLMAKSLNSKYETGKRGKKWFKIKPTETLDLVIVGADWGYGRRTGWLSDYYLAAYNKEENEYEIIGKTFKGLTDEEFKEITKKLLELKIHETEHTVWVKPEIVVEVAFNEIQKSPKYKSGYALRFARIVRIRIDKSPNEVDTIIKVKQLYEKQFKYKGLKLFNK